MRAPSGPVRRFLHFSVESVESVESVGLHVGSTPLAFSEDLEDLEDRPRLRMVNRRIRRIESPEQPHVCVQPSKTRRLRRLHSASP